LTTIQALTPSQTHSNHTNPWNHDVIIPEDKEAQPNPNRGRQSKRITAPKITTLQNKSLDAVLLLLLLLLLLFLLLVFRASAQEQ
jgi:hypothetical protein